MASDEVTVTVNGEKHEGWKSVTVRSSIEELASSFSIDYTQRWTAQGAPVGIHKFDSVQLTIGSTLVLTGYVDRVFEEYDEAHHTVTASGRSKTGQLVDCEARAPSGAIKGKDLLGIAEIICKPFGISVSLSEPGLDVGDPTNVQIEDGASAFQVIDSVARTEGVLLLSDPLGNLVLARAASAPLMAASLRSGVNIKRGSYAEEGREQFSSYRVKGQAPGSDVLSALGAATMKFELADPEVPLYRPVTFLDHQATVARLRQRATWERNTRAGRANPLTYDVQGWRHASGLWQPNTLAPVFDTTLGVNTNLLITGVDFQRTLDGGKVARLELFPRETYDVLKPPKPPKRKRGLAALLGQ